MIYHAIAAVALAVLIGETIKVLVQHARGEKVVWFHLGGMPSTHASSVTALATAILFEQGLSLLFLLAVVFGWIVCRDAYGVRWEVTRHSEALNKLAKTKTYERAGHTQAQVIAGVALGLVVALLVYGLF